MSRYVYCSNSGRVACRKHGGGYLEMALERDPGAKTIVTPLDYWERFPEGYRDPDEPDFALLCETCVPLETRYTEEGIPK